MSVNINIIMAKLTVVSHKAKKHQTHAQAKNAIESLHFKSLHGKISDLLKDSPFISRRNVFCGLDSQTGLADWTRGLSWK